MTYWSWWVSGTALAAVMLLHWLLTRRLMAVSGRVTALVDRVRHGAHEDPGLSHEELIRAIQEATALEFDTLPTADSSEAVATSEDEAAPTSGFVPSVPQERPRTLASHGLFLGAIVVGGFVAALQTGRFHLRGLDTVSLQPLGGGPTLGLLLIGGALVGFGTRMAGGCTSGHGLCGTSRFQPGSLLATACFFGAGIVTSFAIRWLLLGVNV
ncbi:MAG TPA: YeeE/YedE thiosulfate transporter family protein [Polyangiaceae bacterium]|nr:YeeE/YedE thiosulfate transporter family protein [Polyangiaceae bacterium]